MEFEITRVDCICNCIRIKGEISRMSKKVPSSFTTRNVVPLLQFRFGCASVFLMWRLVCIICFSSLLLLGPREGCAS